MQLNQVFHLAPSIQTAIATDALQIQEIKGLSCLILSGANEDIGVLEIVMVDVALVEEAEKQGQGL